MIQFSVIIPFYNVELYLKEAIESVINQIYTNWEILLIDDGSKDNSGKIARKYVNLDSRIKLLTHEKNANKGVSASRNLGIKNARGQWLAFLDADDYWFPEKLKKEVEIIETNKKENCVLIYSKTQLIDKDNKTLKEIFGSGTYGLVKNPFLRTLKGIHAHTSNLLVERDTLVTYKIFFNEKMNFAEDTLFMHEVLIFGNLYYIDQVLTYFRTNDLSATNSISNAVKIKGRFEVYVNLLSNKHAIDKKEISFELINTGLKKVWKYFLMNPFLHVKILIACFRSIIFNPRVLFRHKVLAFFVPFSILTQYFLSKK